MKSLVARLSLFASLCVLLTGLCAAEGRFTAAYIPPKNPANQPVYEAMRDAQLLEAAVDFLNNSFVVPNEVALVMAETEQANAFYSPDHHMVIISYELITDFVRVFADTTDPEQKSTLIAGALVFVMFHEIGHCLVAELELPSVGREEDAVDEFATLLLINSGEQGEVAILGAATWFAKQADNGGSTPFWDEHSLDMQRFYGVFALLYGTNPARYAEMAQSLGLPPERLQRAERDYAKKDAAWTKLLTPHLRPD